MIRINLLPHREERRRARRQQFYALLGMIMLLSGLIVVIVYSVIAGYIAAQDARNEFLKKEIAVLDKEIDQIRRLKEHANNATERFNSISQKLEKEQERKQKQAEGYQAIIGNILTSLKGYQKYADIIQRNFVNSYENLLLLVDFKFDGIREAKKELNNIKLESKETNMLNSQSRSLVNFINDYVNPINYDELDKIFSKTIKDLRGRKFLDEKEAHILFENVLGGPSAGGVSGAATLTVPAAGSNPTSRL